MPLPITTVFADLPDPRRDTPNKLHPLTDILTIATCAVIGGAESWEAIAEYGRTKESFFRRFLALEHGIASPDTFERVFAKLAPGAFAQAFGRWMVEVAQAAANAAKEGGFMGFRAEQVSEREGAMIEQVRSAVSPSS